MTDAVPYYNPKQLPAAQRLANLDKVAAQLYKTMQDAILSGDYDRYTTAAALMYYNRRHSFDCFGSSDRNAAQINTAR